MLLLNGLTQHLFVSHSNLSYKFRFIESLPQAVLSPQNNVA